MCGRYSLVKKTIPKEHRYAANFAGIEPEPADNNAPSQLLPIMALNSIKAEYLYWRLLPAWAKDANMHRPFNARAETLTTNGMFAVCFPGSAACYPSMAFRMAGANNRNRFVWQGQYWQRQTEETGISHSFKE